MFGSAAEKVHVADPRPFNDSRYSIDSSDLRALGWTEGPDFDADLAKTVSWYQAHMDWFD